MEGVGIAVEATYNVDWRGGGEGMGGEGGEYRRGGTIGEGTGN